MVPSRSAEIETKEEAVAYYAAHLVGDHEIEVKGVTLTIRFNPEEIHTFSEAIEEGRTPPADRLVFRPGKSGECRVFSKTRARAMDRILDVLKSPARVLDARNGGWQIVGPPETGGIRMAIVVGRGDGCLYVRTSYTLTTDAFRRAIRGRSAKWPP